MRILLAGDSWGLGVWGLVNNEYKLVHPGIDHYMRLDGHDVVNISQAGTNNMMMYRKLVHTLKYDSAFDKIFYIQTDIVRDIPNNFAEFENKWFNNYEHLISLINEKLDELYHSLNSLGKPIYMLAGCSTVNQSLLSKYKNLICTIPSILKFLHPECQNPEFWTDPKWINKLDDKWDLDTLDKIIEQEKLTRKIGTYSHFKADSVHPDLSGYAKVYLSLKEILTIPTINNIISQ